MTASNNPSRNEDDVRRTSAQGILQQELGISQFANRMYDSVLSSFMIFVY